MREWLTIARRPDILRRSVRVALVVGTLLAIINHGERLLAIDLDAVSLVKIGLTYFVPFAVATWSAVQTARSRQ